MYTSALYNSVLDGNFYTVESINELADDVDASEAYDLMIKFDPDCVKESFIQDEGFKATFVHMVQNNTEFRAYYVEELAEIEDKNMRAFA